MALIRAAGAVLTLGLAGGLAPLPAAATVYEYGPGGRVLVNGAPEAVTPETPAPGPVAARRRGYRDLAEAIALRHAGGAGPRRAGLDALTFARIFVELIRAESAFDPRAVSPKGARGLGQLMPETARALGVADPFDPAQNLDGSARYFAQQLDRFGDVRLALAAYNAGPHRVVEHVPLGHPRPGSLTSQCRPRQGRPAGPHLGLHARPEAPGRTRPTGRRLPLLSGPEGRASPPAPGERLRHPAGRRLLQLPRALRAWHGWLVPVP